MKTDIKHFTKNDLVADFNHNLPNNLIDDLMLDAEEYSKIYALLKFSRKFNIKISNDKYKLQHYLMSINIYSLAEFNQLLKEENPKSYFEEACELFYFEDRNFVAAIERYLSYTKFRFE
jgi:hypothetical protein